MVQTVLLFLYELLLECLKKETIMAGKILYELLLLVHSRVAGKAFVRYVRTGNFHGDFVIGLLHLRHVDQLPEKVLVQIEYVSTLTACATLYLLVMQEEHLVNVAWLMLRVVVSLIVSLTTDHFC